ncbi:hypothetical protein ACFONN_07125 [Dyella humi]|uniref:DUF4240 domain-containing protein n=1 Tax=Dyella humi TaxID=1770547 RepID=A0ABW8IJH1_9GAMM
MSRKEFNKYRKYYASKGWMLRYQPNGGDAKYVIERDEDEDESEDDCLAAGSLEDLWDEWSELVASCAEFQVILGVLKQWAFSTSSEEQKSVRGFIEGEALEEDLWVAMEDARQDEVLTKDIRHHESLVEEISFRYFPEGVFDYEDMPELLREEIGDYVTSQERSWLDRQLPPSASLTMEGRARL